MPTLNKVYLILRNVSCRQMYSCWMLCLRGLWQNSHGEWKFLISEWLKMDSCLVLTECFRRRILRFRTSVINLIHSERLNSDIFICPPSGILFTCIHGNHFCLHTDRRTYEIVPRGYSKYPIIRYVCSCQRRVFYAMSSPKELPKLYIYPWVTNFFTPICKKNLLTGRSLAVTSSKSVA